MQGNPKVIAALNEALKEELTAINQYFLHAEMCETWHYTKLGNYIKKQSIDEMKHAETLIERILFLDGTPTLSETMALNIGKNVQRTAGERPQTGDQRRGDVQPRGEGGARRGRQCFP